MEKDYSVGNFIQELRKEKNLTQEKLGKLLDVSNKAVSKWENSSSLPDTKIMPKLCDILGVTVQELLNGKRDEQFEQVELNDLSRLEHVSKFYKSDNRIDVGLSDINLSFNLNEIVAIDGVSGSGKTTLLKVLGGLEVFENGEVYLVNDGLSYYDELDYEIYRKNYISYIFQDYGIIENYSLLDNLILIRLLLNDDYKTAYKKAEDILKKINLYEYKNKKASKLSGGQKQKLSVARALIKDAPIILGDEITANLDEKQAKEIIDLLMKNAKDKLVILVTHKFKEIEAYATRKITLDQGKIKQDIRFKPVIKKPLPFINETNPSTIKSSSTLTWTYLKNNFLKSLMAFILLFIPILGIILANYGFDAAAEQNFYISNTSIYKDNEIQFLKEDGLNVNEIKALYSKDGVEDLYFKRINVNANTNFLRIDNSLKDNEIKAPINKGLYEVYIYNQSLSDNYNLVLNGDYIYYNDKEKDNTFYVNLKNYCNIFNFFANFDDSYYPCFFEEDTYQRFNETVQLCIDLNSTSETIYTNVDYSPYAFHFNNSINEYSIEQIDTKYHFILSSSLFEEILPSDEEIITYEGIIAVNENRIEEFKKYFKNNNYKFITNYEINHDRSNLQNNESIFMIKLLFFFLSILTFIILYFLIKKIYYPSISRRKNELTLLHKLGYNKKSITISVLAPIVICLAIGLTINLISPLIRSYLIIDFYIVSLVQLIIFSYFILTNAYKVINKLLKEVK